MIWDPQVFRWQTMPLTSLPPVRPSYSRRSSDTDVSALSVTFTELLLLALRSFWPNIFLMEMKCDSELISMKQICVLSPCSYFLCSLIHLLLGTKFCIFSVLFVNLCVSYTMFLCSLYRLK